MNSRFSAAPDYDKVYGFRRGWMNLGYSDYEPIEGSPKPKIKYRELAESLATRLAEIAGLTSGDVVVDVGCGYGVQDLHFLRIVPGLDIHAVNISAVQIEFARKAYQRHSKDLQGRIHYSVGDAVCLPVEDALADKVLSLESAFHYRTREKFFHEAMRVLKPGGSLALADVVITRQVQHLSYAWWDNFGFRALRALTGWMQVGVPEIPDENFYDLSAYVMKLKSAGFVDVVVQNISDKVALWPNRRFASMAPWWALLPMPFLHRSAQLGAFIPMFSNLSSQYVLVTGKKPLAQ